MPSGGLVPIRRFFGGFALFAAAALATAPISSASRLPTAKAAPQGSIKYFNVPSLLHDPYWITVGPDGNLWFTDEAASMIGRITLKGKIKEFRIGKGKRPKTIVAGPDGNLWFTESTVDKIGVMNTKGERLHEYAVPTSGATPWGITVGPDGNIWFTEQGTGEDVINDVGQVIVGGPGEGFVTEFELYPCACNPIGVTTGPDGNLWATEELGVFDAVANGTVDRISPDGQTIDRFPVDNESPDQVLPGYAAPGPDGNVWFGEFSAGRHKIGSVDPNGVVTEYTVPAGNATVNAITTGVDGNLWLTVGGLAADDNKIVNMTTAGTILDDFVTHQTPVGITVGPDGNIWFAARANGEIGRLITARPGRRYVIDLASGFVPGRRTVRARNGGAVVVPGPPGPHSHRRHRSRPLRLGLHVAGTDVHEPLLLRRKVPVQRCGYPPQRCDRGWFAGAGFTP
jgi:streptogramin lyase